MLARVFIALAAAVLVFTAPLTAKTKQKPTLPVYVLEARTVAVVIDPEAGELPSDPQANRVAQRDVETAFENWGRYHPVIATQGADLIVVVQRGSGKSISPVIRDPRQANRPGSVRPTDGGVDIGVQQGREPPLSGSPSDDEQRPGWGSQIGDGQDVFRVYRGNVEQPLDLPPVWQYRAKDALRPHGVPAVDAFRKAVAEAEKANAKAP